MPARGNQWSFYLQYLVQNLWPPSKDRPVFRFKLVFEIPLSDALLATEVIICCVHWQKSLSGSECCIVQGRGQVEWASRDVGENAKKLINHKINFRVEAGKPLLHTNPSGWQYFFFSFLPIFFTLNLNQSQRIGNYMYDFFSILTSITLRITWKYSESKTDNYSQSFN